MIEKELKFRLTQFEFYRLFAGLGSPLKSQSFINAYFDTPDLHLRKNGYGLRLRIFEDQTVIATLKQDRKVEAGYSERDEWEKTLTWSVAQKLIRREKNWETLFKLPNHTKDIQFLGFTHNQRHKFTHENHIWELDRTIIFKKPYCELEIETSNPKEVIDAVKKLFTKLKIPFRPESISKQARFLTLAGLSKFS